ncbi:MAG: hypothetical protein IKS71_03740 [Bacteroidales bacterium]|nr:hypothetical protein [Bacteroidales bacterium]
MKRILIIILAGAIAAFALDSRSNFLCTSAYAQDDDILKMYEQLMTPQEKAILDRFEEAQMKTEEARAVHNTKKTIALIISIIVGLIPFCYLLVKSIKENTWKNNAGGTVWGLLIGLAGGVLLFAINYGIFWFRMNHEGLFNGIVTYGLVIALIVGVIYLLNKKG